MPQIFHRSFNTLSRVSIFGAVFILAGLGWILNVLGRSSYVTQAHVARVQPVPFSHQHHAGQLGIDCRYCHESVESSPFAGMPATKTCMNCHQEIWFGSETLEPVRASYRHGEPMSWQRVHNLPQFVYFDHSIHVRKGNPAPRLRPRAAVFRMDWQPPGNEPDLGQRLMREHQVKDAGSLTSCSVCHR
jgi:hypothetical protein